MYFIRRAKISTYITLKWQHPDAIIPGTWLDIWQVRGTSENEMWNNEWSSITLQGIAGCISFLLFDLNKNRPSHTKSHDKSPKCAK